MLKKISVITINFNNCKGLIKTYDSLRIQLDLKTRVEWIVIDGNSTDGSIDFLNSISSEIDKLIIESDKGIYDAMNKGLAAATGDYVWFLNSGDSLHHSWVLSKLADALRATDTLPDVVYGDTMFVDEDRNELGLISKKKPQPYPKRLHGGSFRFGMNICHQSFLAKRELSVDYNLEYKQASDIDWIIGVLKRSGSSLDAKIVISDFEIGGSSSQNTKKAWKERYKVLENHYGRIPNFFAHIWIFGRRGWFSLQEKLFGK
jgi:glycosyltransferase involved in cell wall biosynthesis